MDLILGAEKLGFDSVWTSEAYGADAVAQRRGRNVEWAKKAVAAVPDKLVDEVALVGPRERIAERLQVWKASPVTSLLINGTQAEVLRLVAELCL
jgi:alkanesulfonate monooxygenase SsuD/methylene tetrahydromethanopterin reductase-like flavin-dependent oxidoreductase (luciferase family)